MNHHLLPWLVAALASGAVLAAPWPAGRHASRHPMGSGPDAAGRARGVATDIDRDGSGEPGAGRGRPGVRVAARLAVRLRSRADGGRGGETRRPLDAEAVASALALLALAYRSGLPTWQVLAAAADQSPPDVAADLRQVAAALQWGAGEREAWASVDPAWAPAARAVSIAHQAGVAPAALLMKAADDARRADLERIEVAAAQVGVRLVLPLGLVLLPAFCLTTVVPLVVSLGRQLLTSG